MILLRHLYAPCTRNLKRLAGVTRSPVYSQLTSTRVLYLVSVVNRWSAMRFDAISLLFIASTLALAIVARLTQPQFSTVDIALTLTFAINLMGLFQWTIR